MRRVHASLLLVVIFAPIVSLAGNKDAPRSLAVEADCLAQNSGQKGWVAEQVTFTRDAGKQKAKGKLNLTFTAAEDKPTGGLQVTIFIDPEHGPKTIVARGGFVGDPYSLVEKDGKRYIQIMEAPKGPKAGPDSKVIATQKSK